jgi:hypothetical protein
VFWRRFELGTAWIKVEVTLRPTVSWPVRLGVLALLEQVTRCYIYLSDNYSLYFSCRAPSLTRGQVCNLQCKKKNSVTWVRDSRLSAKLVPTFADRGSDVVRVTDPYGRTLDFLDRRQGQSFLFLTLLKSSAVTAMAVCIHELNIQRE